jgi:NAD-dependent deacetylase
MQKKKLVVLSGAGISAESGLKTFRDDDGLWMGYDIYEVATPRAFQKNPSLVLDFYNMRRKNIAEAQPNKAHIGLAALEEHFDVIIITQNIDDLHERAGSTNVIHLHGEIFKMRSSKNEHIITEIKGDILLGDLAHDGAQWRPHIVWFEETVPMIETAAEFVSSADLFVLIGTSLQVYPAAGLLQYVATDVPKFIIDKAIPHTEKLYNCTYFEMEATKGIEVLRKKLSNWK